MAENQILDVISQYLASEQTGTIMAVFEDNSLGRFYVVSGVLATARYRNKEGREAVNMAKSVVVTTARFHENADLVRSGDLIDGIALPQVASEKLPSSQPVGPQLTNVMKAGVVDLLMEYVGPVAPLIMSDLPDAIDIESALDQLASEIDDAKSAAEFVRTARRITLG
ncbi:MAG: hypothetical protein WBM41_07680 [Arenicellales bacterium]